MLHISVAHKCDTSKLLHVGLVIEGWLDFCSDARVISNLLLHHGRLDARASLRPEHILLCIIIRKSDEISQLHSV